MSETALISSFFKKYLDTLKNNGTNSGRGEIQKMASKRHKVLNLFLILIPWLSLLFLGKRSIKRYSFAGFFIAIFEIINHLYGRKRNWWEFYDKPNSFIRDELPFDIGPYFPMSLWLLKFSYGNF
ncbi:hypothetical protein [Mesobacillus maritimus]|uniref:hypothetical protein n=1 Tax=Mesobacillus maritimus TaxID=1643336 RepID=UPI0038516D20